MLTSTGEWIELKKDIRYKWQSISGERIWSYLDIWILRIDPFWQYLKTLEKHWMNPVFTEDRRSLWADAIATWLTRLEGYKEEINTDAIRLLWNTISEIQCGEEEAPKLALEGYEKAVTELAKARYNIPNTTSVFKYSKYKIWWIRIGKGFNLTAKDPKCQDMLDFIKRKAMGSRHWTILNWWISLKQRKTVGNNLLRCPTKSIKRNYRLLETIIGYLEKLTWKEAEAKVQEEEGYSVINSEEIVQDNWRMQKKESRATTVKLYY